MRTVQQFVLIVDYGTPPQFRQKTAGRYRVAAKDQKEAIKLLRKRIKFGSIQCFGTAKRSDGNGWRLPDLPYKMVMKYHFPSVQLDDDHPYLPAPYFEPV